MGKLINPVDWIDPLRMAIAYRKVFSGSNGDGLKEWATNQDYVRHKFPPLGGVPPDTQQYRLNIIRKNLFDLIPSVFITNPYVNVTPTFKIINDPALSQLRQVNAKIIEAQANWYMKITKFEDEIRDVLQDHFLTDKGIIKLGYDTEFAFREEVMDKILKDTQDNLSKKTDNNKVEYDVNVRPGMAWSKRIFPNSFLVPYGSRTLDDMPWVAHRVYRKLEDVKESKYYENTKDLVGAKIEVLQDFSEPDMFKNTSMQYQENDWVELIEIRDYKSGNIMVLVPGCDKWIRPPSPDPLQIDGLPFVDYYILRDPRYYWSIADATVIGDQQLEVNEARTHAALFRRLLLLRFLYNKNKVSPEEIRKLLGGELCVGIGVDGSVGDAIAELQTRIPPDLLYWVNTVLGDSKEQIGQNRENLTDPSSRLVKDAVQAQQMLPSLRISDRQTACAKFISKTMRKVIQIHFKFWDAENIAMVVGLDGMRYWVKYSSKEIRDEYDYNIDIESMRPTNTQIKRSELLQLIQIFSKNPNANLDVLLQAFTREFPYVDAVSIFPPAPEAQTSALPLADFQKQQVGLMRNPKEMQNRRESATKSMLLPMMKG